MDNRAPTSQNMEDANSAETEEARQVQEFMDAIQQNNLEQLRELITLGMCVNARNKDGQHPLHLSIQRKNMNIFMSLLSLSPDLNIRDKMKRTPLHLAVLHDQFDMVFLLLESGCKFDIKDETGRTPVDFANEQNLEEICALLTDYMPSVRDPNAGVRILSTLPPAVRIKVCEICKEIPVNCFCLPCGHVYSNECIQEWIEITPTCPFCKQEITEIKPLFYGAEDLRELETTQAQALVDAIHQNNLKQVLDLIAIGVNVSAKLRNGQRPLHLSILKGRMDIFLRLLPMTRNPDIRNRWKQTPLHLAVINNRYDMAWILLESGCNVNAKDENDRRPIHFAKGQELDNIIDLLIDYGSSN